MSDIRGSCTCSHRQIDHYLHVVEVHWESNESGETQQVVIPVRLQGDLICVDTWPGELAIADNYDIELTDELGMDVMGGQLLNRDDTDGERAWPTDGTYIVKRQVHGQLYIEVTNASVKATDGNFKIYFERKNKAGV